MSTQRIGAPTHECRGSKTFGEVRVAWRCECSGKGCNVQIWWLKSLVVSVAVGRNAEVPFSASLAGDSQQRISGRLIFRGALLLDLDYPGGEVTNYELWPSALPEPPPPTPVQAVDAPVAEEAGAFIEDVGEHDLFPYIYMRPWPHVSERDLENRFVTYADEPKVADSLYDSLLESRGDRLAMESEAITFIDGGSPDQGQFIGTDPLVGPIALFAAFDRQICNRPETDFSSFQVELEQLLGMSWQEIEAYILGDPEFEQELDRTWQNLFALTIMLGYDSDLLSYCIRTVVMAELLRRIVGSSPPAPEQWSPEILREGVRATVILPEPVFPLPAAGQPMEEGDGPGSALMVSGSPPPRSWEGIVPYAIGDLQLVRQRLKRYALGEVSYIENVLRGESKETTRRNLSRMSESVIRDELETAEDESQLEGTRCDFLSETQKTLLLDFRISYQTTYGEPQDQTVDGYLEAEATDRDEPQVELVDRAAGFAKRITSRTAERLARQVRRGRTQSSLDENEETVVTRFDGTLSQENVIGIYRWVNKVYEAYVVNYGHRLILEVLIRDPAYDYISAEESLQGSSLGEPTAPNELGVDTYRDISADPQSRRYYASLAARYEATDITPPPPDREVVSTVFQSGTDINVQEVSIPEGYRARFAHVTVGWDEQVSALTIFGVVGRRTFRFESTSEESQSLRLNEENTRVPVAISADGIPSSPPGAEGTIVVANKYLATVEIESFLSPQRFEAWQLETYKAIIEAYKKRLAEYYAAAGTGTSAAETRNPLAERETIRNELRKDIERQLLQRGRELTGQPLEQAVGEPRYLQFFEQAFEWGEMAYSFTVRTGDSAGLKAVNRYQGGGSDFTAFLQAGLARVLLPVSPDYAFVVPYFLDAGMIWDGPNDLTPANSKSIAVLDELKSVEARPPGEQPRSEPWEVRVPTSMVMLQEGSKLPDFS